MSSTSHQDSSLASTVGKLLVTVYQGKRYVLVVGMLTQGALCHPLLARLYAGVDRL